VPFVIGFVINVIIYFAQPPSESDGCSSLAMLSVTIVEGFFSVVGMIVSVVALWNVEDAYVIKQELAAVLFVGTPVLIVWAVASFFDWTGGDSANLWSSLFEIFTLCLTIWMPLIRSFDFDRALARKHRNTSDMGSVTSSETSDDDFNYVTFREVSAPPSYLVSEMIPVLT